MPLQDSEKEPAAVAVTPFLKLVSVETVISPVWLLFPEVVLSTVDEVDENPTPLDVPLTLTWLLYSEEPDELPEEEE